MLKINRNLLPAVSGFAAVFPLFVLVFFGISCQSGSPATPNATRADRPEMQPASAGLPGIDSNYLLGKFAPAANPDFAAVGQPYSDKPGMFLRKEALEAFEKMWQAAKKDGVVLKIISSTRTFDQQKSIWEAKWTRFAAEAPLPKDRALKILEYSSMPGSSRHHWGTDVDLNDLNNPTFQKGGKYEKVYNWLSAHAHEYGFCQPYTPGRPTGYHEEKWHWSYTPISSKLLETYKKTLTEANISGFKGSETAVEIGIVRNYVMGVNTECQQ